MLSKERIEEIKNAIESDDRFHNRVNESQSFQGKEKGHSGASQMEDIITEILIDKCGGTSPKQSRELGDTYVDGNIFNTKFGYTETDAKGNHKYGQPNMCSMKRIMKGFIQEEEMDSYYIIKVKLNETGYSIHIFDMLNIIEMLTWNSGTGQIMLKESEFYKNIDTIDKEKTIQQKKDEICKLWKKGIDDHIALRTKQRDDMIEKLTQKGISF